MLLPRINRYYHGAKQGLPRVPHNHSRVRRQRKTPSFQFDKRAQAKGLNINIIQLTYAGLDPYENPVYSETVKTVKAFVKLVGQEKANPAGIVEHGKALFIVSLTTVVLKDDYEISYGGERWRILAVNPKRSHLEILAERKIEKETKVG